MAYKGCHFFSQKPNFTINYGLMKELPTFLLSDDDSAIAYLPKQVHLDDVISHDLYYLKKLINRKVKMGLSKQLLRKEVELLVQIKSGGIDRERALNYLFEKHGNFVDRGVIRYSLTEVESREVFLDSLLALVSAIEKEQYKGGSKISTYLYRIFENRAKNKLRDRNRHEAKFFWVDEVPIMPDKARTMLEEMLYEEEMDWVEKMLDQMGGKCKQILIMQEFQGYSLDEIAKKLGFKSARAVSTTRYRCMEKLKNILSKPSTKT